MKKYTASVKDVLRELNHGTWHTTSQQTREKATRIIEAMAAKAIEIKATAPKKVRNTKAPNLITLETWEAINGKLTLANVEIWRQEKQYCPVLIRQLIEEFRCSMTAKGKLYADFAAAFQTYLNQGYLSKTKEQCLIKNSPYSSKFKDKLFDRGVAL